MQKPMIPFFNNDKKKNLKVCDCGEAYIYLPRHWGHRLWNDEVKPCIFLLKRRWDLASSYQRCLCPCLHLVEPAHSSNKYVGCGYILQLVWLMCLCIYLSLKKKVLEAVMEMQTWMTGGWSCRVKLSVHLLKISCCWSRPVINRSSTSPFSRACSTLAFMLLYITLLHI